MPKFFVTSDIHGYFDIFIKELTSAGFDKNDENHWLVVCGDCFDRGQQPRELKDYLDTVERKIIIRGNHEDLLKDINKALKELKEEGKIDELLKKYELNK